MENETQRTVTWSCVILNVNQVYVQVNCHMTTCTTDCIASLEKLELMFLLSKMVWLYYNFSRTGAPVFIVHGHGSAFSSIGMAKAALEAINGLNLFGDRGANWSVVYIDIDAHYRNRTTLDSLLPRESASKVTYCLVRDEVVGSLMDSNTGAYHLDGCWHQLWC